MVKDGILNALFLECNMSLVLFEISDHVAILTLNNPEKRNMLTLEVCSMISAYVAEAETSDRVKALIVTGTGSSFCAGGQLTDINPDRETLAGIYSGFLSIAQCEIPTIAAVNGPAVGAGFNMAIGCDVRIVSKNALFEPRFFGLGLHPGGGSTWMTRQLACWDTAAGMLIFSQAISGELAVKKGLAWKCVDHGDLLDEAIALTSNIRDIPKAILLRTKKTLRTADMCKSHNDILEIETEEQLWSIKQPFARDAISNMINKISSQP
ncbi:MAG: enoyl-CoA hydratase [Porticoccaceae bacterium]|nr:enoyl-CoA hydratase [Porticoccaceae bacterium]